jgi:hypothetical protein
VAGRGGAREDAWIGLVISWQRRLGRATEDPVSIGSPTELPEMTGVWGTQNLSSGEFAPGVAESVPVVWAKSDTLVRLNPGCPAQASEVLAPPD